MIVNADCLEHMKTMESNSISFIVTDPPYGLKFMGKHWDHGLPSIEVWKEALRVCKPGAWMAAFGGTRTYHRLTCSIEDAGWEIRDCMMWLYGSGFPKSHNNFGLDGYGTALKPAWEPIMLAMKPLDGTFKQNAETWGQGGINIDDSRVEGKKTDTMGLIKDHGKGRWPANIILDEEAGQILDEQIYIASRFFYCAKASSKERNEGLEELPSVYCKTGCGGDMPIDDDGKDRDRFKKFAKNHHPTVKPLSLMRYILKLLAPPSDPIVLDPFAGSGSTLVAAKQLGIRYLGIEKEPEYCEISKKRLVAVNDLFNYHTENP